MKHIAIVKGGKVELLNPDLYQSHINTLEGKRIAISIKRFADARSLPQNDRHWARMTQAAEALGDRTPEELHWDFRALFLTDRTTTPPRIKSSTELSTEEFAKWEEDIDRTLAEVGIVLPEPEEG